jgi:hypothetical protein
MIWCHIEEIDSGTLEVLSTLTQYRCRRLRLETVLCVNGGRTHKRIIEYRLIVNDSQFRPVSLRADRLNWSDYREWKRPFGNKWTLEVNGEARILTDTCYKGHCYGAGL